MTNLSRESIWTVRDILQWTFDRFKQEKIETPLLDAQVLLSSVLQCEKVQLYANLDKPLSVAERLSFRELVKRRISGEPVAYLLKNKYWHDLELYVDSRVLIPRPETETLLDFIFKIWEVQERKPNVILDLCTGSGCLAIALARKWPGAKVIAVDISRDAIAVGKQNAKKYNMEDIEFIVLDICDGKSFEHLISRIGKVDVLVSNPPYIPLDEWEKCSFSVRSFEPKVALVADDGGFAVARTIYNAIVNHNILSDNSCFAMELGIDFSSKMVPGIPVIPCSQASWDFPRNKFFGLRDLTYRERFLCKISGLQC